MQETVIITDLSGKEVKEMINDTQPGDRISIDEIRAERPDKRKVKLPSIVLTISR